MLKTLTLKGVVAKKFGRVHRFHVADIREMLRAMCSQVPGFKKYMSNAHHSGVRFAFFRDGENIGVEEFELTSTASEFTMMPVTEGAKQGGVLQIVIGAVALVAAFFTAGGSLALWGAAMSAGAISATTVLTGIGLSMMLGGVVQMLTPQPKINIGASSSTDNKPNYAFGAPVNTVAMGYPVPLLYGKREIGGAIISAGLFSSDQQ
ncbi:MULTISPECIES: tail assembly protein [Phytobacter]|uniref:Tail assembly protein n=1 Tax=Phytobacter diazotrophicus TaxID=395631 RepID=A0ABM7VX43_9ENTR|nr:MULTISPECIES: tail assembly protein [Phytobacter]BBE78441.1 tail assembly protein [Phytobacter sp. MRY16-398]BDD51814.1 tail assembly protein [Phytobacter diazotrophicus]BEG82743.1 tail assembly protein [Phytobacter diazotrophicus]BEG88642.1 tail assembly protein [Phytobacter diazotrophicus]BEG94406.1 tail assembly protein [Phytobacter diazotrophicus]